jgi:hypothetical protein
MIGLQNFDAEEMATLGRFGQVEYLLTASISSATQCDRQAFETSNVKTRPLLLCR